MGRPALPYPPRVELFVTSLLIAAALAGTVTLGLLATRIAGRHS
ncbi:hypothetical protein CLV71_12453 [Actinophytocola oryzae]|uniref:Uncharacterized protein n=1 Tax=Actinophytocola oryzae TaxID=502181 RepID=A0A4R7UY85_9PSEU|nr:hypothetical protein CLV71_12453 [Actinophytocola oryzae]